MALLVQLIKSVVVLYNTCHAWREEKVWKKFLLAVNARIATSCSVSRINFLRILLLCRACLLGSLPRLILQDEASRTDIDRRVAKCKMTFLVEFVLTYSLPTYIRPFKKISANVNLLSHDTRSTV